jgi:hypothetical protein
LKGVKILIGFLTLFSLVSAANLKRLINESTSKLNTKQSTYKYLFKPEEIALLQEGDIIMRRGYGVVSSMISNMNDAPYNLSHCAFIIQEKDSSFSVIHSVSSDLSEIDGVQKQSINGFTRECVPGTIVVIRHKGGDPEVGHQIADAAKVYLADEILFDHHFDLSDSSTFYCSELIYRVYGDVFKKDCFPERLNTNHPTFLTFPAFMDSSKFDLIINHQGEQVGKYFGKK